MDFLFCKISCFASPSPKSIEIKENGGEKSSLKELAKTSPGPKMLSDYSSIGCLVPYLKRGGVWGFGKTNNGGEIFWGGPRERTSHGTEGASRSYFLFYKISTGNI